MTVIYSLLVDNMARMSIDMLAVVVLSIRYISKAIATVEASSLQSPLVLVAFV